MKRIIVDNNLRQETHIYKQKSNCVDIIPKPSRRWMHLAMQMGNTTNRSETFRSTAKDAL